MAHPDHFSLKPRHFQLLVSLDEFRNIGKVAANVNITQPAVSKALAELEAGLGVKLFERTARGIHPTIYGECLIRRARTVLSELSQARDELRGLMSGATGKVAVGSLAATALALLPRSLALLKQRSPGTTVFVREGSMESLLPDLLLGKLDLIVGRLPHNHAVPGLEEKILMDEPVSLVADRHHTLVKHRKLSWQDLQRYPWVLPPVGTLLREPLELAFLRHGLAMPTNHIETISVNVIIAYLQLSDALAVLAGDVSRHYRNLGLIAILPLELPTRVGPLGMRWSRQRPLSPSARLMMECLEQAADPAAFRPARSQLAIPGAT